VDGAVAGKPPNADAPADAVRRRRARTVGDCIYGVLGFGAAQRTRELGNRRALGADSSAIVSLVIGQGLRRAAAGIVIGLAGSFALTRFLQSLLFGIGAFDPPVFASVTLLLFGVATAACYIPARRATRLDPTVVLRDA
jgi:putative ABC transport system permease protein